MSVSPLSGRPALLPGAAIGQAQAVAPETAPTLEVPFGVPPSAVGQTARALPAERTQGAPSLWAGTLRPAVLAVLLGAATLGLAAGVEARELRGAPVAEQGRAATTVSSPARALGAKGEAARAEGLQAALARILAADADHDGLVAGGRWKSEIDGLDPLARAVYDYVNYVNPRGSFILWGLAAQGDYVEGGLGVGHAFRPKHMTANEVLLRDDLVQGVRALERALTTPRDDQAAADLRAIVDAAKGETGRSPSSEAIHQAAEHLLDVVRTATGQKELRTGKSAETLTNAELLAALEPGSLEHTIARVAEDHGVVFFARPLEVIRASRRALGAGTSDTAGAVGDAQQHYLLVLSKAAREEALLEQIRARLP